MKRVKAACLTQTLVLYYISTVYANGIKLHIESKTACNNLATRTAVTDGFLFFCVVFALCGANARECKRAARKTLYCI